MHAVRVAARLRRELDTEVEKVRGRYGQFRVFVDGRVVIDGGRLAMLGVLPPAAKVVETVRRELAAAGTDEEAPAR